MLERDDKLDEATTTMLDLQVMLVITEFKKFLSSTFLEVDDLIRSHLPAFIRFTFTRHHMKLVKDFLVKRTPLEILH